MEHVLPFLQTLLWVVLIGGIVWRFNAPLHGLLTALQRRVEAGSGIKAGPFELSAPIRTQLAEEQKEKTTAEIQAISHDGPKGALNQLRDKYIQVEDLALRAVQLAYKVPIGRQVVVGLDARFDGAFTKYENLYVVEVKYVPGEPKPSLIREALERASKVLIDAGVRKATIVLAVVFDDEEHVSNIEPMLPQLTAFSTFPCDVRLYSHSKLLFEYEPNLVKDG